MAAYDALGLDWHYEAIDVDVPELEGFLAGLDDSWAGVSLTMPLKLEAARLANFMEPQSKLVGVINTLIPSGLGEYRQWVGANTDIHGIVAALAESGARTASRPVVIGAGATATAAVAALGAMGAVAPQVILRNRASAGGLLRGASKMGLRPRLLDLGSPEAVDALTQADVVISTIPVDAGAELGVRLTASGQGVSGHLLDVVYSPLVTPLASAWSGAGGIAISGTRMLLNQAGEQVRLMTGFAAPLAAMNEALSRVLTRS